MYTGITRGLFEVILVEKKPGLTTYVVELTHHLAQDLTIGASVSVDGVCQTVVASQNNKITFNAIDHTLQRTTLDDLYVGRKVSIENSLRYGDIIGGHEMAGHVIGTAEVMHIKQSANNLSLALRVPEKWLTCILTKGFIGVDGSSLTVGEINPTERTFNIHLIPETLRVTNFGAKQLGDRVNIELDFKTQAIVHTVERILKEKELALP